MKGQAVMGIMAIAILLIGNLLKKGVAIIGMATDWSFLSVTGGETPTEDVTEPIIQTCDSTTSPSLCVC